MVDQLHEKLVAAVHSYLSELDGEISERNQDVESLDEYIYGDKLEKSLDIPIGHDKTPINWLRRAVSIHKDQFMSRGFQLTSTYDSIDVSAVDDKQDRQALELDNKKRKQHAQQRRRIVDAIIDDNGGYGMWSDLAESASATGTAAIKSYYDKKNEKWVLSPIERIENFYAYWEDSNFRRAKFHAFVWQVDKSTAIDKYGIGEETPTSPLGQPLVGKSWTDYKGTSTTRPMVTMIEVNGKIPGWKSEKGRLMECSMGSETRMNVLIAGNSVVRILDKDQDIPFYYILPNRRERARPWGRADVTDAAIHINMTYIETLSDWRTVSSKVNFPKWKALGFSLGQQIPKPKPRTSEILPLGADQDIQPIDQGQSNQGFDFKSQMEELKEQFVRETGLSPVLFNDPSVNVNSNQALLTTMKPTTDIAEAKKNLWGPVIVEIFEDALSVLAQIDKSVKEVTDDEENWSLAVRWPSHMPKEDPVYQSNLINRFNAGLISIQTYLESIGDSGEEMDRIRDELEDPVTGAIIGRLMREYVTMKHMTPEQPAEEKPKVNVSLRGDLTPYQEANLASQYGFNQGPYPPTAGPQGSQGQIAQENLDNQGFLQGNPFQGGTPIQRAPDGSEVQMEQGTPQVTPPGANQEGQGIISQPGSGATPVSPEGLQAQQQQQEGN